ncbi:HORMA domain-containing protein 1-like isoform X2 [Ruditapes philippinarum]|uniref:HORMA domain-containing protein 1-like isoform X2 n=1 Tax=Ruditapes philippinarum TaxID=129788 RepID=UPI00295B3857|nr:HORMA domain-containing protein 1-like isoform X2 [Ruditapes philippinarum]
MATTVLQKPAEKTGTWGAIFPNEQISEVQSALFVKKLLAVAVSNIAYLRAIFPEHAFGDRSLEGLSLKILKDDVSCPGASQVIKWVKGCFDAFDRKYLRMLMIGLYVDPDNPETVIESYTFKFSYVNDGGIDIYRNSEKISGAHTESETRKATIRLLRTIILLTQTLDSLPDDVMMTMKLLYYDDVTPEDYEPPGFKAADSDNFVFDEEPMTIKVGDVNTNYHSVKVRVKTDKKQFTMRDPNSQEHQITDAEINSGLDTDISMEENNRQVSKDKEGIKHPTSGNISRIQQEPQTNANIPEESPAKPTTPAVDVVGSQTSQATDPEEYKVRCPCGCNEDDGLMVMCAICKFWQHGVCFLIVEEEDAPDHHICDVCAQIGDPDREPTDFYLSELSSIQIQATCLWRRALIACLGLTRVLAPVLAKRLGTEMTVAQGLMNRLDKEGFLKSAGKGKKLGKLVDKEKITNVGIPKYMKKHERQKEADHDNKTEMTQNDKETNSNLMDTQSEVDKLTEKTESLKINKKGKLSRKKKNQNEKIEEVKKENITYEENKVQEENDKKRKGRKRAVSKSQEDQEFELSSTQDVFDDPKKRKKASIVSKDIMV